MRRKSVCCTALIVMSVAGTAFAGDNGGIIFNDTSYLDESDSPFDLFDPGS